MKTAESKGFGRCVHISGKHRLYWFERAHAAHALLARCIGLGRCVWRAGSSGGEAAIRLKTERESKDVLNEKRQI
jgi:hypothetical protein